MSKFCALFFLLISGALTDFVTEDVEINKSDLMDVFNKVHSKRTIYLCQTLDIDYPTTNSAVLQDQNKIHFEFQFPREKQFGIEELVSSLKKDLSSKITLDSLQTMAISRKCTPTDLVKSSKFGKHVLTIITPLTDINEKRVALIKEASTFTAIHISLLEMQRCLFENFTVLNKSLKVGSGLALENGELEQISSNASLTNDCYLSGLPGEELSDVCKRYLSESIGPSGLTGNQREYFLVEMFKPVVLSVDQNTKTRIISVSKDDLIKHINENFFLHNSTFGGCSVVTSADGRKSFDLKENEIVPFFRKTLEYKVPNIPGLDAKVGLVEYLKYIVANAYIQKSTPKDSVKMLFSCVESEKYLNSYFESKLQQTVSLEMPQKQLEDLVLDRLFETGIFNDYVDDEIVAAYDKSSDFHFPSDTITISGLLHNNALANTKDKLLSYVEHVVEKTLSYYSTQGLNVKHQNCASDIMLQFKNDESIEQFNLNQKKTLNLGSIPENSTNKQIKIQTNSENDSDWKAPPKTNSTAPSKQNYGWLVILVSAPILVIILCLVFMNYSSLKKYFLAKKNGKRIELSVDT